MRKRDLIRRLRRIAKAAELDMEFVREGASHELWRIGDERIVVPRHREINERTATAIIKKVEEVTAHGKDPR